MELKPAESTCRPPACLATARAVASSQAQGLGQPHFLMNAKTLEPAPTCKPQRSHCKPADLAFCAPRAAEPLSKATEVQASEQVQKSTQQDTFSVPLVPLDAVRSLSSSVCGRLCLTRHAAWSHELDPATALNRHPLSAQVWSLSCTQSDQQKGPQTAHTKRSLLHPPLHNAPPEESADALTPTFHPGRTEVPCLVSSAAQEGCLPDLGLAAKQGNR